VSHVSEYDANPLGLKEVDAFRDLLWEGQEDIQGEAIEMSVRDTGNRTMFVLRLPEKLRACFSEYAFTENDNGKPWIVPATLELSPQAKWITDSTLRAKAKRRKEVPHLRIPLNEIHVSFTKR
jgi:hypothetical protein